MQEEKKKVKIENKREEENNVIENSEISSFFEAFK